jgi:tRNA/tmRNA/rRNA uracil-C5-methylase (TrmA/RlmC/RlmD family)
VSDVPSEGAPAAQARPPRVGERITVTAERVAHGGHVVARHDGRVVFVRHAIPGEVVEAVVTGAGPQGRYLRADAVRIVSASPDRVEPPCRYAGPGRCGGCDWQHVSLDAQRSLKAEILREQLHRLGGIDEIEGVPLAEAVAVVPVAGDVEGLGWRTRVRYAVAADGTVGLRRHRSHAVEVVDRCALVTEGVDSTGVTTTTWPGASEIEVVCSSRGDRAVVVEPAGAGRASAVLPRDVAILGQRGRTWVGEDAGGRSWRVRPTGFWQVHPGAPDALVDAVREALAPRAGEHLLDLYSGVGLFAGCLAGDLGPTGRVDAVEASVDACRDARRNLHDLPQVRIHQGAVDAWLATADLERVDLVVLDPPRSGAGAAVLDRVMALRPRAIAYVACDPAALGRDVAHVRAAGWRVGSVRGLDLFPMTQHVEAVALLLPG